MSRPCDHCCIGVKGRQFKRVKMFMTEDQKPTYLCSPCARELGYKP